MNHWKLIAVLAIIIILGAIFGLRREHQKRNGGQLPRFSATKSKEETFLQTILGFIVFSGLLVWLMVMVFSQHR